MNHDTLERENLGCQYKLQDISKLMKSQKGPNYLQKGDEGMVMIEKIPFALKRDTI